ncbi:hypothetical protein GCM10009722_07000 [Williamsia deligens]
MVLPPAIVCGVSAEGLEGPEEVRDESADEVALRVKVGYPDPGENRMPSSRGQAHCPPPATRSVVVCRHMRNVRHIAGYGYETASCLQL